MSKTTYNGWKNYATWNVILYINNSEGLYYSAIDFMRNNPKHKAPYRGFIAHVGLLGARTLDGIKYDSVNLSYRELNAFMRELIN